MFEVYKTRQARIDLKKMWKDGYKKWGEAQADAYFDLVSVTIDRFADYPEMGRTREEIRAGYRAFSVRQHIIFYTLEDNLVMIQRVLPSVMEYEQLV